MVIQVKKISVIWHAVEQRRVQYYCLCGVEVYVTAAIRVIIDTKPPILNNP